MGNTTRNFNIGDKVKVISVERMTNLGRETVHILEDLLLGKEGQIILYGPGDAYNPHWWRVHVMHSHPEKGEVEMEWWVPQENLELVQDLTVKGE